MRRIAYLSLTCAMVLCVLIACERPAFAYVDPGSGLFLLQGISSAVLGILYVVRRKLRILKGTKSESAESSVVSQG